jgi:hypothetical protein
MRYNISSMYLDRAQCYFYMQELHLMYADLVQCLELDPKNRPAYALLSLYEKQKSPFEPFPTRTFAKMADWPKLSVSHTNRMQSRPSDIELFSKSISIQ